jgi:hypothetical protein
MRTGVHEPVAVGWATAQVAALLSGPGDQGGGGAKPGSEHLAPGLRAQLQDHATVRGIGEIDRTGHLGQPDLDAVRLEHGSHGQQLRAAERSIGLPHHDRVEDPVRVGHGLEEFAGVGRRDHGRRRVQPTSKYSATIRPWPPIRSTALSHYHHRDEDRS